MNSNEDDSENMFFSYFSSSFKLFFAVVSFNILSRAAHTTKTLYQKGSHPWEKPFPSYIDFRNTVISGFIAGSFLWLHESFLSGFNPCAILELTDANRNMTLG